MSRALRVLTAGAIGLAFIVIVVGAYVRLSDAGLGCPDWPLCYGKPVPETMADRDALAKAWKEMGHRYLAGTLGLVILAIGALAWKLRRAPWLATFLVALLVFQATLGKWTVTMLLKPAIVTAHLLGGMAILGVLLWHYLAQRAPGGGGGDAGSGLRSIALLALAVLVVQIALGGWVSANYAALACPDLPGCRGQLMPPMDFGNAFHVVRELGMTPEGELLSLEALVAIHWTHRMFAAVALVVIGFASHRAARSGYRALGRLIALVLLAQFALGLANVAFELPLPLAAAHNAGAALLLACLVVLNFQASRKVPSP